jgi:hypothetical protein
MKLIIAVLLLYPGWLYANTAIITPHESSTNDKTILFGELNTYRDTLYNNWSIQHYSTDWTYGVQIYNVRLDGIQMQNYENDTYLNISRKLTWNSITLESGVQAGYNFSTTAKKLHATSFIDASYEFNNSLSLYFGGYYVNDELATIHQPYNFETGIKYKIGKVTIVGDYYSGHNNLSGASINVLYKLTPVFRPYLGILVPEKDSGNEFAGTIGFSYKLF